MLLIQAQRQPSTKICWPILKRAREQEWILKQLISHLGQLALIT